MHAVKANNFSILHFELSNFIKQYNGVALFNTRKKFQPPFDSQQGLIAYVYP
jgi:hypothetical protein